jgi:hypothetical protein
MRRQSARIRIHPDPLVCAFLDFVSFAILFMVLAAACRDVAGRTVRTGLGSFHSRPVAAMHAAHRESSPSRTNRTVPIDTMRSEEEEDGAGAGSVPAMLAGLSLDGRILGASQPSSWPLAESPRRSLSIRLRC